jgi:hypothetical protein
MTEPLRDERSASVVVFRTNDVVYAAPVVTRSRFAWSWIAIGVWVLVLTGVGVRVAVQKAERQSVVPIYLTGGERWLHGESLYPPILGMDLYRNPPGVAALFARLSLLPAKPAAIVWRVACVVVYLIGIRNLLRDVLPPLPAWRRAVVWSLAAVLAIPAINNGQINLMIVAAALCGVSACARNRWWAAAAWLAFAGWFKIYPFAIGLLSVVIAPQKLGWRLAVMTALLFGLPFLLQNPRYVWDRHVEFVREMQLDDRTRPEVPLARVPRDWTIIPRLAFEFPVPRELSVAVGLAFAAGMAGMVMWLSRRLHPPAPSVVLFPLVFGLIWITLFGPGTEMNTYSVLAPVAGVLAVGTRSRWVSVFGGIGGLLLAVAIVRASFPSDAPYKLIAVQPIAAGLLLIAAVGSAQKQKDTDHTERITDEEDQK